MQEQLERDLKAALLSGDKQKVETLKSIKNAFIYEKVSLGGASTELNDEQINKVLARESKKRGEAAEMYEAAGETERAKKELAEKSIIDAYLPDQVSEDQLKEAVNEEIAKYDNPSASDMGKIIGAMRQKFGATAEGSLIAKLVKEALSK